MLQQIKNIDSNYYSYIDAGQKSNNSFVTHSGYIHLFSNVYNLNTLEKENVSLKKHSIKFRISYDKKLNSGYYNMADAKLVKINNSVFISFDSNPVKPYFEISYEINQIVLTQKVGNEIINTHKVFLYDKVFYNGEYNIDLSYYYDNVIAAIKSMQSNITVSQQKDIDNIFNQLYKKHQGWLKTAKDIYNNISFENLPEIEATEKTFTLYTFEVNRFSFGFHDYETYTKELSEITLFQDNEGNYYYDGNKTIYNTDNYPFTKTINLIENDISYPTITVDNTDIKIEIGNKKFFYISEALNFTKDLFKINGKIYYIKNSYIPETTTEEESSDEDKTMK